MAQRDDFSELSYSIELIEKELRTAIERLKPEWRKLKLFRFLTKTFTERAAALCVYSVCFCRCGDQLSQWRAYSGKGTGYAIGFDLRQLQRAEDLPPDSTLFITEIVYDVAQQLSSMVPKISRFINKLSPIVERPRSVEDDESFHALMAEFSNEMFAANFSFKNPAFQSEKEWRIFQILDHMRTEGTSGLFFREMEGNIVPYIKLQLPTSDPDQQGKLPIVEIIQGPLVDPALGEKSLRLLLKKCGYEHVDVRPSKVPIRF